MQRRVHKVTVIKDHGNGFDASEMNRIVPAGLSWPLMLGMVLC